MNGDDGGISLEGTLTMSGAGGTFVLVDSSGVPVQMPEMTGILSAADPIKLEHINAGVLGPVDGTHDDQLESHTAFVGDAEQHHQMIQAIHPAALTSHGLVEGLATGTEVNFGEQYVINTGDLPEGVVGMDGSVLPQAFVPIVMDFESHDMSGMTLAAQLVDNGEYGGQKMIILTPSGALQNTLQPIHLLQPQEEAAELLEDNSEEILEHSEVFAQDEQQYEEEPPTKRIKYEEVEDTGEDGGGLEAGAEMGIDGEEETADAEVPGSQSIKVEDDNAPVVVLTMTENCEEVTETQEEIVSNIKNMHADTDVTQAWFTTKDDKLALQNKGHQWKQGQWTKEEIEVLDSNIAKYCVDHQISDPAEVIFQFTKEERKDFYRTVAKGLQRPLFSVYRRVIRMYDQKNHIGKYTPEEIVRLKELKKKHGSDWAKIGAALGRSASSVKDRCRLMKDTCNSGKWLPEEEKLLAQAVYDLSGCTPGDSVTKGLSWAAVADKVGTRSEKQCRTKWLNFLNWKQLGGTEWTREDDIMLITRLGMTDATDETEVDWKDLAENWPSARSPQWLRGKWWTLKRHVPDYQNMKLSELLEILKKIHYPKAQIKSSLMQDFSHVGKMDLQSLGVGANMTLIPVTSPAEVLHAQATVDSLQGEIVSSQGMEMYPGYTSVISSQPQGTFLITQPATNGTIAMAGPNMGTDQIIVHTLPITQEAEVLPDGGVTILNQAPQQVIITATENHNGVHCLASAQDITELQLGDIHQTDPELHHLTQSAQIVASPVTEMNQSHMELPATLGTRGDDIMPQEDHFPSQLSESDMSSNVAETALGHVNITDVTATAQFVQATGGDFMENMSSFSDPMLPSEGADLIGSCSDTEGEKSQDVSHPAS